MRLFASLHQVATNLTILMILPILAVTSCGPSEQAAPDVTSLQTNSDTYRSQGQYRASIIEARNAIQTAPEDERGYIALARTLIEIGQPLEAIDALTKIKGSSADYYLTSAEAYFGARKFDSASDSLATGQPFLSDHQTEVDVLKGKLELAQGDTDDAEARFDKVIAKEPHDSDALLGLASVAAIRADFIGAETTVKTLLENDPKNAHALLFASSLYSRIGDMGHAEDLLMQAMAATPTADMMTPLRFSILTSLRDTLTAQGRTSEALVYSRMIAESMPGAIEASNQFDSAMDAIGKSDFPRAQKLLAGVQSVAPNSALVGTMLGVVEYLNGNTNEAVKQFERFLDPETATPQMLQTFALAEVRLNRPEEVLNRLADHIDTSNDARLVSLYGIACSSAGKSDEAEKYLLRAIELDSKNALLRLPLAQFYEDQDKQEDALAQLRAAFESQPEEPLIQSALISRLMLMNRGTEAAHLVEDISTRFAKSPLTQLLAAQYYRAQHDLPRALAILNEAITLGDQRMALLMIAEIRIEQKEYDLAESRYRELIRLNPEDQGAYDGLINLYQLRRQPEKGVAALEASADETKAAAPLLVLSDYFGKTGQYEKASALLKRVESASPVAIAEHTTRLVLEQAQQQLASGAVDAARKTIVAGLSEAPDDVRLLSQLVTVELRARNVEQAEFALAGLVAVAPESPVAAILAGDIAGAKGDFAGAEAHYRNIWRVRPSDELAGRIVATIRQRPDSTSEELLAFYDEWLARSPDNVAARLSRGAYYMGSGDLASARKDYEDLLAKGSDLAVVHNNLAWIYAAKDLKRALSSSKRAYALAPKDGEIADTYGWFLYKNGDVSQAKEILAQAVQLAPTNEEIRKHLDEVSAK